MQHGLTKKRSVNTRVPTNWFTGQVASNFTTDDDDKVVDRGQEMSLLVSTTATD